MSPEDSEKIREILLRAFDLPLPARAAFLDEACAGDAELRELADALLGARTGAAELAEAGPAVRDVPDGLRSRRLRVGELVDGKYRIEAPIGAGGMGEVYLARQLVLNRVVAIKVLPTGANAGSGKRFQREALAVGSLHHPNIVTVHDLGLAPGLGAYLVMEFVDGHSLADELSRRKRLPIPEAVELMRQVCAGVAAAHAAGMIHRDLKPGNILLGRAGEERRAKVADFGLAKLVEDDSPVESLTVTGALVGTPPYMSPEQCVGDELDARSDVYSLGCILYEMITGVRPFTAPNQLALLRKHVSSPPTLLRDLAPGASAELEAVVARALAKKPGERWQTAAELGRALAALAAGAAAPGPGAGAEATDDSALTAVLPADSGDSAKPAQPPTNVPEPATRCIGREGELERIASALRDPQVRLLTLTGAGGTGKTRLAYEAARVLLPEFPHGVFVVELAALDDPTLVASHVGGALGLKEVPGVPPAETLGRHLADRRMLLVLDNFEHLVEAAPFLAGLLSGAPGVKLLVTSRALLHLSSEHEVVVDPLAVPPPSRLPALEVLSRMPAVALFVERAREAKPGFELTRENAAPVAEICRRLDGLPLAIELAAARAKLLTPQAMLARLESRLKLLTGGARDLPGRQQTMRGALAWSYDLLGREEKELLERLAVFAGGCTLEAAEAVCGEDSDVLDGLGSLVDKSLVRQRDEGGEPRFTMLEVVREFALEQLAASGGEQEARLAHARYFLAFAQELGPKELGLTAPDFARLTREHENLRAALWFLADRDPASGARLAAAVALYLRITARHTEGRVWLERALAGAEELAIRAQILSILTYLARVLGDPQDAVSYGKEAVESSRASGDGLLLAKSLVALGAARNAAGNSFDIESARAYTEEALAVARAVGASEVAMMALNNLGEFARVRGDYAAARGAYLECLEMIDRHAVTPVNAIIFLNLGAVTYAADDYVAAFGFFRESLETARTFGDDFSAANALDGLAALALDAGDPERAARVAGATGALYESMGAALDNNEQEFRDRLVARLAETLGPEAFGAESERGRAMSLDAAVAEALRSEAG